MWKKLKLYSVPPNRKENAQSHSYRKPDKLKETEGLQNWESRVSLEYKCHSKNRGLSERLFAYGASISELIKEMTIR